MSESDEVRQPEAGSGPVAGLPGPPPEPDAVRITSGGVTSRQAYRMAIGIRYRTRMVLTVGLIVLAAVAVPLSVAAGNSVSNALYATFVPLAALLAFWGLPLLAIRPLRRALVPGAGWIFDAQGIWHPAGVGPAWEPWSQIKDVAATGGLLLVKSRKPGAPFGLPATELNRVDVERVLAWAVAGGARAHEG